MFATIFFKKISPTKQRTSKDVSFARVQYPFSVKLNGCIFFLRKSGHKTSFSQRDQQCWKVPIIASGNLINKWGIG